MALSSYENLGYTNELKTANGIQIGDWEFELYKNWVYIYNAKLWDKSSLYVSPVVGSIKGKSNIDIMGLNIHATEGPQNSTICLIANKDYSKFLFGIAAYGYKSEIPSLIKLGKKLGKRIPSEKKGWIPWATSSGSNNTTGVMFENTKNPDLGFRELKFTSKECPSRLREGKYVGIMKSTYNYAIEWLKDEFSHEDKIKVFIDKLKKKELKSCNGGDLFFQKAGIPINPETDMAKPKKSMLAKAIDNMKSKRIKKSNNKERGVNSEN